MADFGEAFGKGLLDLSDMMIKDSFEDRAFQRKEVMKQQMWEERNAITNPQAVELKEMEIGGRKDAAGILADAKVEAADKTAGAKVEAADKLAQSKLTLEDKKAAGKATAADLASKKADRVPVYVETQVKEADTRIKALSKEKARLQAEGEDVVKINQMLRRARKHLEVYAEAQRDYAMGRSEAAAKAIGNYQQSFVPEQQKRSGASGSY